MDVGNLIFGSSAFSKSSLDIWKFSVHVLLKPSKGQGRGREAQPSRKRGQAGDVPQEAAPQWRELSMNLGLVSRPTVWLSALTTRGLWGRAGDDSPRSAGVAGGLGGPGVQAGLLQEGVSGQEAGKTPPHAHHGRPFSPSGLHPRVSPTY